MHIKVTVTNGTLLQREVKVELQINFYNDISIVNRIDNNQKVIHI